MGASLCRAGPGPGGSVGPPIEVGERAGARRLPELEAGGAAPCTSFGAGFAQHRLATCESVPSKIKFRKIETVFLLKARLMKREHGSEISLSASQSVTKQLREVPF